jgi:4'-phosphopantetheinyl transferase
MPGNIIVYYADISDIDLHAAHQLLDSLPAPVKEKLELYRLPADRLRGAIGKHLLLKILQEMGYGPDALLEINVSKYKRPYINETVDFNISHSGNRVVVAAGQQLRLGVDIEEIGLLEVNEFACFFTENEIQSIKEAETPGDAFYTHWTRKEAVLKANGKGLHLPLNAVEISGNLACCEQEQWFLHTLNTGSGYDCHLAASQPCTIQVQQLWFCCSSRGVTWTAEAPSAFTHSNGHITAGMPG